MAKQSTQSSTFVSEGQGATYMNKSGSFLAEGVWYITTPCPALREGRECLNAEGKLVDTVNGLIDEEVVWADAKTPHHAGLIADQRHWPCAKKIDEQIIAKARAMEIRAAEYEVERIDRVLADQKTLVTRLEADIDTHPLELEQARKRLAELEPGPEHARKRLADTIIANG